MGKCNYVVLMALFVFMMSATGCGLNTKGVVHEQLTNVRTTFINPTPDPRVERIITEHFFTSPVEWNAGAWDKIVRSRYAISAIYTFLKNEADTTGTISAYDVMFSSRFVVNQWFIMKTEMDIQDGKPGAVEEIASVVWGQARDKVDLAMKQQVRNLEFLEKELENNVSETMLKQYNDLFNALQPIADLVM